MIRDFDTTTTTGKVQVMQSASAGNPVTHQLQRRLRTFCDEWQNTTVSNVWDWLNFDYRIDVQLPPPCPPPPAEPTPREWKVTMHDGSTIRVREVLP